MSNPIISQPTVSVDSGTNTNGSIWSDIGRVAGKAFAFPFRAASTVVNAGVFGAYYVSTVTISGLVLTGSALVAPLRKAADHATGKNPGKSLSEYVISPAKKTYNFISRLYHELPEHASEKIFAGVTVVAAAALLAIGLTRGARSDRDRCSGSTFVYMDMGTQVNNHYHGDSSGHCRGHQDSDNDSYAARLLRPYKVFTDVGAALMNRTTQWVNGRRFCE